MSANSEILGNFGAKHSIDVDGKVLEARYFTGKMKTAFEKHLFKRARNVAAMEKEDGYETLRIELKNAAWLISFDGDLLQTFKTKQEADDFAANHEVVHAACLGVLKDKCLAGEYAMESRNGLAHMNTPSGQLFLASLIFDCDEQTVVKMLSQKPAEVKMLIELVMAESMPMVKPNPNPAAPGKS